MDRPAVCPIDLFPWNSMQSLRPGRLLRWKGLSTGVNSYENQKYNIFKIMFTVENHSPERWELQHAALVIFLTINNIFEVLIKYKLNLRLHDSSDDKWLWVNEIKCDDGKWMIGFVFTGDRSKESPFRVPIVTLICEIVCGMNILFLSRKAL